MINKYTPIFKQTKKVCVYVLICPIKNDIVYIGVSYCFERRVREHGRSLGFSKKCLWVEDLRAKNLCFSAYIIKEFSKRDAALKFERKLIMKYKSKLLNSDKFTSQI